MLNKIATIIGAFSLSLPTLAAGLWQIKVTDCVDVSPENERTVLHSSTYTIMLDGQPQNIEGLSFDLLVAPTNYTYLDINFGVTRQSWLGQPNRSFCYNTDNQLFGATPYMGYGRLDRLTDADFVFTFYSSFTGDFNLDGENSVGDIFDYLSAWFNNSEAADTVIDNRLTVNDIFVFLEYWFAG